MVKVHYGPDIQYFVGNKIISFLKCKSWNYFVVRERNFLVASEDTGLKTGNFQSLTRKTSYSSFFSVLCPDFKNVFFLKKILSPFQGPQSQEATFKDVEAKFWISSIF